MNGIQQRQEEASGGSRDGWFCCGHLVEDLQHIQVPIGIELVPSVVAGNGYRDCVAAQLVQQGHPPPPWGALAPLIPVLYTLTHTMLHMTSDTTGASWAPFQALAIGSVFTG